MGYRTNQSATKRHNRARARAPELTVNGASSRTPRQLDRQERIFNLSVLGRKTVREIAAELDVSTHTVVADLRCEQERRSEELGERREIEKACAVAFYQHIAAEGMRAAESTPDIKGLDIAIRARTRIDAILGLNVKTPEVDSRLQLLVDALKLPDDDA